MLNLDSKGKNFEPQCRCAQLTASATEVEQKRSRVKTQLLWVKCEI